MWFLSLGRWNSAHGSVFSRKRFYAYGYKWTPFVRVSFRYNKPLWHILAYILPADLVYFAVIRLVAHATTGKYGSTNVVKLSAMDALERWRTDLCGEV